MSNFNYFCGGESGQFSFFRIPQALISDKRFQALFVEAKLLYALLLDRMGLSLQNGWQDENNRVFIFYTLQEAQETLSCGHNKATRLFNELERFGLIERVKQGQGKPAKIYVKNFADEADKDEKADLKASGKSTSCPPVSKPLDCPKGAGIYTEKNQTDFSYINQSINPLYPQTQPTSGREWIDGYDCQQRGFPIQAENALNIAPVTASMAFGSTQMPLVRGRTPPKTPYVNNASHRETHLTREWRRSP